MKTIFSKVHIYIYLYILSIVYIETQTVQTSVNLGADQIIILRINVILCVNVYYTRIGTNYGPCV